MKNILPIQHKTLNRILMILALIVLASQSFGQGKSAKKPRTTVQGPLQLAEQYYASGEYYTAALLYEQYLHPAKPQTQGTGFPLNSKRYGSGTGTNKLSRTDIMFKQADSYRLANVFDKAADIYAECAGKDSSRYADAMYWKAVCQRSLGQYDEAQSTLNKVIATNASNKEAAEKELQTIRYIRQQLSRKDSVLVTMKKINAGNSEERGAYATTFAGNNQFIFSSTQSDTTVINGVNPNHSRLYTGTLNNGTLDNISELQLPGANPADNQGAASLSADGKFLYFSQWKKENGRIVSAIYYTSKQDGNWSQPVLLPLVNVAGFNSKQPFCTKDGKYLYFSSDRQGGSGQYDIWYAALKSDGTTSEPVNAGAVVNSSNDEQSPFYQSSSSTLVFSSNGRQGMGGFDLFSAQGSESNWKAPENLGHPVNSSRDDIYFFAAENAALLNNAIFSSDRGMGCCLETYQISKASKSKTFNGILRDCGNKSATANTEVVLKDGTGKLWKTTTDENGKYSFDIGTADVRNLTLTFTKESYNEMTYAVNISNVDESDLLVDKLTNQELCIDKTPEPEPIKIKAEDVVTVYFQYDKSLLEPEAKRRLDSIYNVLVEYPNATIQISGYTDGRGTVEYNKKLSDRRAKACADYLIKKGIDKARVSFVSFGSCCPVEMELINGRDNADGRSKNRRALINVKKD